VLECRDMALDCKVGMALLLTSLPLLSWVNGHDVDVDPFKMDPGCGYSYTAVCAKGCLPSVLRCHSLAVNDHLPLRYLYSNR
jgi:hypothetical protein